MDYTRKALKDLCKEQKIKGYSKKSKDELIKLLQIEPSLPAITPPEEVIPEMEWNKETYLSLLEAKIKEIIQRPEKVELTYDFLDNEKDIKDNLMALHLTQRKMKRGTIWQYALGNYKPFKDLGVGHITGLDLMSTERKIIVELKNRTNTDNASSRKANKDKLAKFKQQNPDHECIYGMINAKTKEETMKGKINILQHNGVEIKEYIGMEFMRYILGEDTDSIMEFVKKTVDTYYL